MAEDRMLNDEILLGLIKANSGGGGGGTTDYEDLENLPEINSVELKGNKSLADLGIQNALTAGDYIDISAQNEIKVNRSIAKTQVHKYNMFFNNGRYCTITKYIDNEQVGSATTYDYLNMSPNPAEIDDVMTLKANGDTGNWLVTNLVASHDHTAGYVETRYRGSNDNTYVQEFDVVVDADKKLIIQSELDDAMATKQDILTFDDTPTNGSNNPVKSNGIYDALATKANTDMVAADFNAGTSYTAGNYCVQDGKLYKFKNNHSGAWSSADVDEVKIAGELSALKSGLTNVEGWNKLFAFGQTDKAATLSFSGTAKSRSWIGEIVVVGQNGVTSAINVSTGGASDSVVNLSETYLRVSENSYGISGSASADGTIRIGSSIYGNWGAIYVRSIHDHLKNATISIAYDS